MRHDRPRVSFLLCMGLVVLATACGGEKSATSESPTRASTTAPAGTTAQVETTNEAATTTKAKKEKPEKANRAGGWSEARVPGYSTSKADVYRLGRQICGVFSPKKVAKEYHTANDPVSAAEGYAKGYQAPFQQPAFEGCLAGFGL